MLAVGGTDNGRQKNRNRGYDVIVGGEFCFTDYSDHPRKLATLNPKPQINRRRTLPKLLSRWWLPMRVWPPVHPLLKSQTLCCIAAD